jgi:hypothetical protein
MTNRAGHDGQHMRRQMTGSVAGHDGGVSRVRLLDAWYYSVSRKTEAKSTEA